MNSAPLPPVSSPLVERLASLADPARLRLLALVEERELGVSELAEILQLPQSTVSRHLKVLSDLGWVVARSERTANFYRMANGELPEGARELWRLSRAELDGWTELAHDRLRLERVLAARRSDARAFFAGVASEWDRLRTELYGDRFTLEAIAALLPADAVVADLACGSGAVTALLAPAVGRVIAVDASPEMLRAARARTKGLANVELRRGDLSELPMDTASCDAALLLLALTHLGEPARAAAELARILRPGGHAVVVDLLRHDRDAFRRQMGQLGNGFEPAELAALLAGAGLADVRCRPLAPEPKAKGPALLLASGVKTSSTPRTAPGSRRTRERKPR
jgi:ArsR family transcriptional regulator